MSVHTDSQEIMGFCAALIRRGDKFPLLSKHASIGRTAIDMLVASGAITAEACCDAREYLAAQGLPIGVESEVEQ